MVRWSAEGTEYPRWWHRQWGRQQFCWFFKLDKYAMFSFAMTSGLASDSDKFKIIITLHRAQKFGDTGPYKNFDLLFNPLLHDFFRNFSRNPLGEIQNPKSIDAIGRAGLRKEVGLLRPGPRGLKVLQHQMVRWSAGGMEYPRWWHWQWGRQQFCWFFKLDKLTNMPCSVLPWQTAWQVILISLKSS